MATRFTKKDYIAVAKILAEGYTESGRGETLTILDRIRDKFIDLFQSDNERFDKDRFINFMSRWILDTQGDN